MGNLEIHVDMSTKLFSGKSSSNLYPASGRCDLVSKHDVVYTPEPMPFIQSVANGKLVVNTRTRDMLSLIEKPLVVISIAGLYRTGITVDWTSTI